MTNSWMNDAGEPIMDGAAWRFEQQLDLDSQADYEADHFYDNDGEAPCESDPSLCEGGDLDELEDGTWECSWCGTPQPSPRDADDQFMMEDQYLDGSWEE